MKPAYLQLGDLLHGEAPQGHGQEVVIPPTHNCTVVIVTLALHLGPGTVLPELPVALLLEHLENQLLLLVVDDNVCRERTAWSPQCTPTIKVTTDVPPPLW